MKKIILLSICASFALADTFINPLPSSNRSIENGGILQAIDAYKDGVGAEVVTQGRGIDNSPMNNLVFKYGASAKINNVRLDDEVIILQSSTSSSTDKSDAVKINSVRLALEGTSCNDNDTFTMVDKYINGVCAGTRMGCINGYNNSITWNIACNSAITSSSLSDGWLNLTSTPLNLYLYSNNLTNVNGLSNLISVGTILNLSFNPVLSNVDGLLNLKTVGSHLYLNNTVIENLNGLTNLESVGGALLLRVNSSLSNIGGLSKLKSVGQWLYVYDNPLVTDISVFNNLINVGNFVTFDNRTYSVKMNANSYLCQNYATKISIYGTMATATTKNQVCNP